MSTWDKQSFYYSGQGVLMLGGRDEFGKPAGLLPVANVSALSITLEEAVEEHKESQSGQRGVDLRLPTELTCTVTMMMESFVADNLAIALRAGITKLPAGTVTNEDVNGYLGLVSPLQHIMVSNVVVNAGATPLILYVDDDTPWDYKVNPDAGSLMFNAPGGTQPLSALATAGGEAITGISVAAQAVLLIADTSSFAVGGQTLITGVVGTMSTALNNKTHNVVAIVENVSVTIATATTGFLYTSGGIAVSYGPIALEVDYSYAAQNKVDALTEGAKDRYLRFEGLNTADDLKPVVVEIFKYQTSPLAELALINEGITGFELEGSALSDPLQPTGSKYFKQTLLR
jgi:hypothetical protein